MPQIVVLPHEKLCPEGAVLEVPNGTTICDALLGSDIEIEHACEKSCACTTCHVVIREGYNSLNEPDEREEDLLPNTLSTTRARTIKRLSRCPLALLAVTCRTSWSVFVTAA